MRSTESKKRKKSVNHRIVQSVTRYSRANWFMRKDAQNEHVGMNISASERAELSGGGSRRAVALP